MQGDEKTIEIRGHSFIVSKWSTKEVLGAIHHVHEYKFFAAPGRDMNPGRAAAAQAWLMANLKIRPQEAKPREMITAANGEAFEVPDLPGEEDGNGFDWDELDPSIAMMLLTAAVAYNVDGFLVGLPGQSQSAGQKPASKSRKA